MTPRYPNCPIAADLRQARLLGKDLARTMRKLKAHLRLCRKCARAPECPVLVRYHALVGETVREVLDEWRRPAAKREKG